MSAPALETRTRNSLLALLKQHGPSDSQTLAGRLGITPMAVRQHLYALRDADLVAYTEESRKMGRPAKLWHLLPGADRHFPEGYRELAQGLLDSVQGAFGNEGMTQLLSARAQRQIAVYGKTLTAATTLREKLEALAVQRSAEGYMAGVIDAEDGSYLLVENHCPICEIARACTGLCSTELEVFRTVLGPDVIVERTEHIVSGARRCAYRIADCKL